MNKLKRSLPARCIAVLLTMLTGTAATAGFLITIFTLNTDLYELPLDTVAARESRNMQVWYSAKIFSRLEEIARQNKSAIITENKQTLQTELADYLHTDNFEFGILHADTVDPASLKSEDAFLYENFTTTRPDHNSLCTAFVQGQSTSPGRTPKLLESLTADYQHLCLFETDQPDPGSVYWIVSNVKNPVNAGSIDIFTQQHKLLSFLYQFRYPAILLTIFLGLVTLALAGFCCFNTRNKVGSEQTVITWRHRTPLILNFCFNLGVAGTCGSLVIKLLDLLLEGRISIGFACILGTLLTTGGILAILFLLMNISVRANTGIFRETTLWYRTYSLIRKFFQRISRICLKYTTLVIRCSILMAAVSFVELVILLNFYEDAGIICILWLVLKLMEFPLALILLIQMKRLQDVSRQLAAGDLESRVDTRGMFPALKKHGEYLNQISDGMTIALEERLRSERFKTELITNVSHDIKTPLTSLINYVDLLKKEGISHKERTEYLDVLERQSARLKKLIEDLIEASKASTGNLDINMEPCDIQILLTQAVGEFEEKLSDHRLELMIRRPDHPVVIPADNRHLWRIFDNLLNNISKYSLPGTRVYIDLETDDHAVRITFRNISRYEMVFSGTDLAERFVRGDASRNTEGNGLGLSIAGSLAEAMNGTLDICIDGDLFKAVVSFTI